jgi:hypothetical protein
VCPSEWHFAVIRSKDKGKAKYRFVFQRRSSGSSPKSGLDQFLVIHGINGFAVEISGPTAGDFF